MSAVLAEWPDDDGPVQAITPLRNRPPAGELSPEVAAAIWRGTELGHRDGPVITTGFPGLDRELPGGGWPCNAVTDILSPQASVLEWRLLGPALRAVVAAGKQVVVISPPTTPHLPGLRHAGLDAQHVVWIQARAPAERLWCTEQLIKSNSVGAILSWLPQARPEQIRRLQVCAQGCDGPVFLLRPGPAQHDSSAAPLRVLVRVGIDWELQLQILKRRGPAHDGLIWLASIPGGLDAVLTPRTLLPSRLIAARLAPQGPSRVPDLTAPGAKVGLVAVARS
jgi:protein ImuA